jgi:hypothetical protein
MNMTIADMGELCIMAMAVIGSASVLIHIAGQFYLRRKWRRMERERQSAIRSGVILKGGGK